jgi:hypothetical protein
VLIPIDAQGQPTGEKYQVPEPMWARLTRLVNEVRDRWLLVSAQYRARLVPNMDRSGWNIPELRATFEVEVLQSPAAFPLPILPPPGAPAATVLVNGRPVVPAVPESGGRPNVELPSVGRNEVEVIVVPEQKSNGSEGWMRLAIPPLPQSWFQLAVPPEAPQVEVLRSFGPIVARPATGVIEANLGPVEELWIRWVPAGLRAANPEGQILCLVNLGSEKLVADLAVIFDAAASVPDRLELELDPAWEVDAASAFAVQIIESEVPGGPKRVLWFSREEGGVRTLGKLRLVRNVPEFSGNLFLSFFRFQYFQPTRRWIGFTGAADFQVLPLAAEMVEPLSQTNFLQNWGESIGNLLAVWSVPTGSKEAGFIIRRSTPRVLVQEYLQIYVQLERASLEYLAEIDPQGSGMLLHRLRVPKGFNLEELQLAEQSSSAGQTPCTVLWPEDGLLVVRPQRLVPTAHRLRVRGWLPLRRAEELELPLVRLEWPQGSSLKVDLWSAPTVVVNPKVSGVLQPQPVVPVVAPPDGRFVGAIELEAPSDSAVRLLVRANRPQVTAKQVFRLDRTREGWVLETTWFLELIEGQLEQLEVLLPEWAQDEWSVDPPGEIRGADLFSGLQEWASAAERLQAERERGEGIWRLAYGAGRQPPLGMWAREPEELSGLNSGLAREKGGGLRRVQVIFDRPISTGRSVRLIRRLEPSGRLLRIPLPVAVGLQPQEQWLMVAQRAEVAFFPESLTQLQQGELPAALQEVAQGGIYRCYRLSAARSFLAAMTGVGEPTVWLAWVRCHLTPEGKVFGSVEFEVDPAGRNRLLLRVPSELKILRTSISGGYSQPLNAKSNIWEVQLPHPILPAFVSVLFEGQMASQSANWWDQSLRLPIPYLEDCRVREIWWQLSVDARFGSAGEVAPLSEPQNLERRPLAEGALDRLRTLVTSLRLATVYLPALTEPQKHWLEDWSKRWEIAEEEFLSEHVRAATSASGADREYAQLRNEVAQLIEPWEMNLPGHASTAGGQGVWRTAILTGEGRPGELRHYLWRDSAGGKELLLKSRAVDWRPAAEFLLGLGLAFCCFGIAVVGRFRRALALGWQRYPWVGIALVGLSWWLFLAPSVLGLVILVAGVVGGFIFGGSLPAVSRELRG